MFNSDIPSKAELPTTAQLIKSTIIAIITAVILLITVVLPAEYAIDPTGIGRLLKLTEMGEIKQQLAKEAEEDRRLDREKMQQQKSGAVSPGVLRRLAALLISPANANERIVIAQAPAKKDQTVFTLKPSQGVEYKMTMVKGAQVNYSWKTEGGPVNYDMHGTPLKGKETSYKTQRGVAGDQGVLTAAYDGSHGWFWRNRGSKEVTITLITEGAYSEIKRVK